MNGPPAWRVPALLGQVARDRRHFGKSTAATEADVRRVWRQLEADERRNGLRTTRLRSRGPDARKALEELRWLLAGEIDLPPVPLARRGRTVDTLTAAAKTLDQLERLTLGERVLLLLDARADARRRGFTRRNPAAFERAVLEVLAEKMPPGDVVIAHHRDAGFTPIVLTPEAIVKDYSPLADKLRTRRAVKARFQLDDRTTRLRRRRRTRQTHI